MLGYVQTISRQPHDIFRCTRSLGCTAFPRGKPIPCLSPPPIFFCSQFGAAPASGCVKLHSAQDRCGAHGLADVLERANGIGAAHASLEPLSAASVRL